MDELTVMTPHFRSLVSYKPAGGSAALGATGQANDLIARLRRGEGAAPTGIGLQLELTHLCRSWSLKKPLTIFLIEPHAFLWDIGR